MTIRVYGFDHVNIRVADLDRALRFYTGVLGLQEIRRSTSREGKVSLLALRAGDSIIFLQPSPGYEPPDDHKQSGLDHYSLKIDLVDPQALLAALRDQHVEIVEGPVTRDGAHGKGTSIYVRDPDGHRIEIKQYNLR